MSIEEMQEGVEKVILPAGKHAATSIDVPVREGEQASIAMFMVEGPVPDDCKLTLCCQTPGADRELRRLWKHCGSAVLQHPGVYRVRREDGGHMVGAYALLRRMPGMV